MDTVMDTGRLLLRRFTTDDLDAFYQLGSRPEIIRHAQAVPLASREQALEFMKAAPFHDYATYGYGRFACVWKATGEVIGFSGIKYVPEIEDTELGYRFLPEYWGRGLATALYWEATPPEAPFDDERCRVVLCPGRGGGTNMILIRSPRFRTCYQGLSYPKHKDLARKMDLCLSVYESFRAGCDIDRPEDLAEILLHGKGEARSLLEKWGFQLSDDKFNWQRRA